MRGKRKFKISPRRHLKKKGFFLIFALWIFLLLTLFCLGLGFRTQIETKKTKLLLNRMRVFYLALSGIKKAESILKMDDVSVDHLQEKWAKPIEEQVHFSSPKKEGKIFITIEDEEARINVNMAKIIISLLVKLFEARELENPQQKADCLLDYIDKDFFSRSPEVFGCEDKENVKNQILTVPEEIILVKNISVDDYKKVKDFITIFGDRKININTATKELLEVLIESDSLREQVFEVRFPKNDEEQKRHYRGDKCSQLEECEKLPLALQSTFKTSSNFFRIISEAEIEGVKKKITCILERDSDTIVYWYEQ